MTVDTPTPAPRPPRPDPATPIARAADNTPPASTTSIHTATAPHLLHRHRHFPRRLARLTWIHIAVLAGVALTASRLTLAPGLEAFLALPATLLISAVLQVRLLTHTVACLPAHRRHLRNAAVATASIAALPLWGSLAAILISAPFIAAWPAYPARPVTLTAVITITTTACLAHITAMLVAFALQSTPTRRLLNLAALALAPTAGALVLITRHVPEPHATPAVALSAALALWHAALAHALLRAHHAAWTHPSLTDDDDEHRCWACAYDLTNTPTPNCPECGSPTLTRHDTSRAA